jgi:radical SAM protein with 4Fe4S-binding SPASM domain
MSLPAELQRVAELARLRPRGWFNLLFNTAMAKARLVGPLRMPVHLTIEPTNACNLRCPVCETGNGSMTRSKGMLDFDAYCGFIDRVAPTTASLMFYFMGEPFLNRHAYEMIRHARRKGIYVETCTNGETVDPDGVIYSDVNDISFQIGGMSQATHEQYRVRGNLARLQANLDALVQARRRSLESKVTISVGFIVMKHNEHEIPAFLNWAREVGVDRANIIDPCVRNVEEGKLLLPEDRRYWFYDEESFAKGVLKPRIVPVNECTWIWNSLTVNWDGSAVPCCRDPQGGHVFGNVFERPLPEIWNGPEITAFRRRIVTDQRNVDICRLCSGYGVPQLIHAGPVGFEINRLSLESSKPEAGDNPPYDIPN